MMRLTGIKIMTINVKPIRIGVLGAAAIVPMALTNPAKKTAEVQITAIAARDQKRAAFFARKNHIRKVRVSLRARL